MNGFDFDYSLGTIMFTRSYMVSVASHSNLTLWPTLIDVTFPREMPIEEDEVFLRRPAIPSLAAHNEGSFDDIEQAN